MGPIFHKPKRLDSWQEGKEQILRNCFKLQGYPLEPHSSRFFRMPATVITAPKEHTTLSGLVGKMCWSSCQLGENHSSGSQPSGAMFSWTNRHLQPGRRAFLSFPGAQTNPPYLLVPTSRAPAPPRHTSPPFLPAPSAFFTGQRPSRSPRKECCDMSAPPKGRGHRGAMW